MNTLNSLFKEKNTPKDFSDTITKIKQEPELKLKVIFVTPCSKSRAFAQIYDNLL